MPRSRLPSPLDLRGARRPRSTSAAPFRLLAVLALAASLGGGCEADPDAPVDASGDAAPVTPAPAGDGGTPPLPDASPPSPDAPLPSPDVGAPDVRAYVDVRPADDGRRDDAGAACAPLPKDPTQAFPFSCVSGTVGGGCGDLAVPAICVGGVWGCPSPYIQARQCGCFHTAGPCRDAGEGERRGDGGAAGG